MENSNYRERVIDEKVEEYLKLFGAICIEGPKWCGKTWTAIHHSNSAIFIGDPAGNFQNRQLAELAPSLVLEGEEPRLLDEWQEVPPIWDAVRYSVDMTGSKGKYILTGSATPNHKGILHSGAGRIGKLHMRPMSLWESGDSSGKVSLHDICTGKIDSVLTGSVDLRKLVNLIVRGGWPGSIGIPAEQAVILPKEYLEAIISDDVSRIDGVNRNKKKMQLLLRSLARNESTTASNRTLKNDIKEIDDEDVDVETVKSYLDVLLRLFLIEDQPPYSSSIRSSVRVKQSPKHHFCDPSLACALLGATPAMLIGDLETLGFLFEALCERDLRIYAESWGGKLFHYQDYAGKEIDAVIETADGDLCAFEIKLGANQIDQASENLLKISRDFENDPKAKKPVALCVICGMSNAAYIRQDGVMVVPVTALKN